LSQIENYALTVAADERFDKGTTKWVFVLVGNDLDAFAEAKCDQDGRPFGLIVQKPHVEVWVKKWATIISECKWRHEFYRDTLDLEVQAGDAAAYLQKKHAQYIPSLSKADSSDFDDRAEIKSRPRTKARPTKQVDANTGRSQRRTSTTGKRR
jgi:hypothetical protein